MTEKELRDKVLLAIYNRKDSLNIDSNELCKLANINFENDSQLKRIFKALKDGDYIEATFFESGDSHLRHITSKGIDYVEAHLLEAPKSFAEGDVAPIFKNNEPVIIDLSHEINIAKQSEVLSSEIALEKSKKKPDEEKIKNILSIIQNNSNSISSSLNTLRIQKEATAKQAEAEKRKGKSTNKAALKDYETSLSQIDILIEKLDKIDQKAKTTLLSVANTSGVTISEDGDLKSNRDSKKEKSKKGYSDDVIQSILSLLYPFGGTSDNMLYFPTDFSEEIEQFGKDEIYRTLKHLSSINYIELKDDNYFRIVPEGMTYFDTLNQTAPPYYLKAEKNLKLLVDKNTEPCMGIENLATSFIELLGSFKENDSQMLGIFGSWGRGKTYFFNYAKSRFIKPTFRQKIKRIFKRDEVTLYTAIEFNAWKYQETPAIWAYLFETIFKAFGNRVMRFLYSIWRRVPSLRSIVIFAISILFGWLLYYIIVHRLCLTNVNSIKSVLEEFGIPIAWLIAVISLFKNFINNPFSSYKLIKKYAKDISFNSELGIQSEIEKELETLLKYWLSKRSNRKVVLFIDDIDRCSEHKIISIIDSLRTILENEEIRKRLIVVCAIDDEKLGRAIKHKYKDLYDKTTEAEELTKLFREQMDKVFLSGIKLRQIHNGDKSEFLQKLIFEKTKRQETDSTQENSRQYPMDDYSNNDVPSFKQPNSTAYNILSEENEYTLLNDLIVGCDKEITPRQIRIIYYRFILARNILHGYAIPMDKTAKAILERSMGNKDYKDDELAKSYWDVVDTVVCY